MISLTPTPMGFIALFSTEAAFQEFYTQTAPMLGINGGSSGLDTQGNRRYEFWHPHPNTYAYTKIDLSRLPDQRLQSFIRSNAQEVEKVMRYLANGCPSELYTIAFRRWLMWAQFTQDGLAEMNRRLVVAL